MSSCLLWGLCSMFSCSCLTFGITRDHYRHKLDVQAEILKAHRQEAARRLAITGQLTERLRAVGRRS